MSVDFEELKRRTSASLTQAEPEGARLESLLRERSAGLAAREQTITHRAIHADVVVVRRGSVLLAFPVAVLQEIRSVECVLVSHATAWIPAFFQVRGRIGTLCDLQPFFGTSVAEPISRATVAMVDFEGRVLGVRVDEVIGPRIIYEDECTEGLQGREVPFLSAVTRDLVLVIDPLRLFQRPELVLEFS